jgi:hypothetical protein
LLTEDALKDILHQSKLNISEKILICLVVNENKPKSISEIKSIAENAGLWLGTINISQYLSRTKGLAIRTPKGWELTSKGIQAIETLIGVSIKSPATIITADLRKNLPKIANPDTRSYLEEAIKCAEAGYFRAAVIMSWVGAISILYDYVIKSKLTEFNKEASRRDSKWKIAKFRDDLALMKESDFLDILESISIIGKSVKIELKKRLDLRNGCGHPNSLKIGENIVAAHIESLILNVFSQFQ